MDTAPEYTRYLDFQDQGPDEQQRYCLQTTVQAIHLSRAGLVHGGMLFSMLDAAMGRAAMHCLGADFFCPTVTMTISYFRPVATGTLQARGRVVNTSKQLCYVEGEIRSETEKLIAKASGTFFIKANAGFVKNPPD